MSRLLSKTFFVMVYFFSLAIGQTYIESPEWSFFDDFESDSAAPFWTSKTSAARSVIPASEAMDRCHNSNVLLLKFNPGTSSWSEMRFRIPIKAQQIEIQFDQYVPSNYVHAPQNQKGFVFWSGSYNTPNIFIGCEEWPATGGAKPAKNLYIDGHNMGHDFLDARGSLMWHDYQGSWQYMHIFIELAEGPGDYGIFEVYRDGEFLIGTHHPFMKINNNDQIYYSTRGNFIDQGYLMGWVNGGFQETTEFYIDNFRIKASSKVGAKKVISSSGLSQ